MISFKKGIKREETAYPTLKDERYFDGFSRSLYITAKSHECEQVLDTDYTPSSAEKNLFEAKQIFMFSVSDEHLLTNKGKAIVRKYVCTTDAQLVWKDFQDHMKSSSKGDRIYIKTQVFQLLRYYSPAPRNIARSDWATQNITHNMTSSIIQPYGLHSP